MKRILVFLTSFLILAANVAHAQKPKVDKDPNDIDLPFKASWDMKAFQKSFDVVKISYDAEKKQINWTVEAKRGFRFVSETKLDVDFYDAEDVRLYRAVYNQGSGLNYVPDNAVKKGDRLRVILTLPAKDILKKTIKGRLRRTAEQGREEVEAVRVAEKGEG